MQTKIINGTVYLAPSEIARAMHGTMAELVNTEVYSTLGHDEFGVVSHTIEDGGMVEIHFTATVETEDPE